MGLVNCEFLFKKRRFRNIFLVRCQQRTCYLSYRSWKSFFLLTNFVILGLQRHHCWRYEMWKVKYVFELTFWRKIARRDEDYGFKDVKVSNVEDESLFIKGKVVPVFSWKEKGKRLVGHMSSWERLGKRLPFQWPPYP